MPALCRSGSDWWRAPAPRVQRLPGRPAGLGAGLRGDGRPDRRPGKGRAGHGGRRHRRSPGRARSTSSSWSAAAAPRPTWPPSTRRRWPGPSPPATVPVWTGIGHTGDQSVADEVANRAFITPTECGQELARVALDYWRGVEDAGAALARSARDRVLQADKALAAQQRGCLHVRPQPARPPRRRTGPPGPQPAHRRPGPARRPRRPPARWPRGRRPAPPDRPCAPRRTSSPAPVGSPRCPTRRLEVEELRAGQRRRLLGAYDYQRQLERGYSVTRDASGPCCGRWTAWRPGRCWPPSWPTGRSSRPSTDGNTPRGTIRTRRRERTDGHTQGKRRTGAQPRSDELSYSDAGAELDEIIGEFETGVVDVDRLVDQLERATEIVDELDRRLRRTRMRVEELVPRLEAIGQEERRTTTTRRPRTPSRTPCSDRALS